MRHGTTTGLDDKFNVQQWATLTTDLALLAISTIAVQPTNQAAEKDIFYSLKQGTYESISTYFTRAYKVVANCEFKCPNCSYGLGDYLLLSKLAVGLSDTALRKEVFRACDSFGDVSALRSFCMAYETASKAGASAHVDRSSMGSVAGVGDTDDVIDDVTVAATASRKNTASNNNTTKGSNCFNYGKKHAYGKSVA